MKQTMLTLLGVIVLSLPTTATAQVQSVVDGNTAFALDLYGELATNSGNVFFSPYSISTCLAMLYAGARGETEAQMAQVLGFETNQQQFASLFGELQTELEANQDTNSVELNIANALWTQIGFPFLPSFLETATNQYQANVNQADFITNAAGVTEEINDWVAQETQNKIQNIVPAGAIKPITRLVLANAIYFQGVWTVAFEETNTTPQPFYLSTTTEEEVPLMYQPLANETLFNYMETSNFQAIELPYGTNRKASMVILLPTQIDGLHQLEQQVSPAFLSNVLAQMGSNSVEIFLPRFTLESLFSLSGTLADMGMPDAFIPGVADFSGIDGTNDLFAAFIFHKAWGQVNESGTEAAAATVIGVTGAQGGGSSAPPPVFRADHPFVFFIMDNKSDSLLFAGRLADPGQSPATPVPIPHVAITPSGNTLFGNNLTISWPYPSMHWTLQQSPDLAPGHWTPVQIGTGFGIGGGIFGFGGILNDGTNNFFSVTPSPGNLFFTLSLQ
jgi:serpin B